MNPMTHRMDGRGEFLTCAIPDQWMALEVCFCYRPDNDLSWVQPKTARKKSLQAKVHCSQIMSTQLASNPPHTTMSCQPPCCQQLKPEARSPFQHECIFLNSNYRPRGIFDKCRWKFKGYFHILKIHLTATEECPANFNWMWLICTLKGSCRESL